MDISALLKNEVSSYKSNQWTGLLGGQEVTLYAKPMSPADNARVLKKYPNFNNSMEFSGMVEYIIIKATDADGNRVFSEKERPLLMRFDQTKIGEIFNALFGDQLDDDDEKRGQEDKVGNS